VYAKSFRKASISYYDSQNFDLSTYQPSENLSVDHRPVACAAPRCASPHDGDGKLAILLGINLTTVIERIAEASAKVAGLEYIRP
jgi:hypothetical protein